MEDPIDLSEHIEDLYETGQRLTPAELITRSGGHVAFVWAMPFILPAEILSWGDRMFVYTGVKTDAKGREYPVYREGLLTWSVDPETMMMDTDGRSPRWRNHEEKAPF